jgi:hypothetical protein
MKQFWQIFFLIMIVTCAAIGGALIDQNFMDRSGDAHRHAAGDMHALFHYDLNLNALQNKELEVIEKNFRRQKVLLEEQMND